MRIDNAAFAGANSSSNKKPRYVVRVSFDNDNTDFVYFTSHANTETPDGATVIENCVRGISVLSQKINPDQGNSTIGNFNFTLVDTSNEVTEKLRDKLNAGDSLRHKRIVCYVGYENLVWADYKIILTYIIDGITYKDGEYKFQCSDIQRIVRKDIFNPEITYLSDSVTPDQDYIPASTGDTTLFPLVLHDSSYSDRPNEEVGYIRIEDEIICHSGLFTHTDAGVSFQVVQRGALNTVAKSHVNSTGISSGRGLKITEHIYLAGAAPKVAYQVLTGHVAENLCLQSENMDITWTVSNAVINNDVTPAPDGSTADRLNVTASDAIHELNQAITVTSNEVHTVSAFVKNDGERYAYLNYLYSAANNVTIVVDLDTQTVTDTNELTSTLDSYGVVNYGDYSRIWLAANLGAVTAVDIRFGAAGDAKPSTYTDGRPQFLAVAGEDLFFFGAQASKTSTLIPYVATTTTTQSKKTLPDNWHLGIGHDLVRLSDFTTLGQDDWNQFDDTGRHVRFEGHKKVDGKKFIETQIMYWLAAFMPIYADGQIGVKRLSPILSDSGYVVELNSSNIVSYGDLKHDYKAVINQIVVDWNYVFGKDDYTKTNILIDSDSLSTHNDAPIKKLKLRGVHTASHTDEDLNNYFDSMRDRYSGPPERLSLVILPSLNTLEVGDVVKVTLDQIRDFNVSSGTTLNRAFEIQQVSTDWITGNVKLDLFGSSQEAGTLARTALSSMVSDSFYTAEGTELSTVLTISANAVTANGSLTGGETMAEGIYYYDGNLTINSGVTVTISDNVELRIKGSLTINGAIDGAGNGHDGGVGATLFAAGGTTYTRSPPAPWGASNAGRGSKGFIGNTQPSGHLPESTGSDYGFYSFNPLIESLPSVGRFSIINESSYLTGVPTDLRGSSGSGGGFMSTSLNNTRTIRIVGTDGGAGGAGLMIINRGMSFGVNGSIDLSGIDGVENSATYQFNSSTYHGSSGAGGAPGALLVLIDGNHTAPELSGETLVSNQGNSFYAGDRLTGASYQPPNRYAEMIGFSGFDMGKSAYRIQYLPVDETPEEEQIEDINISGTFLQTWTLRQNSAGIYGAYAVAYGNGLFVMCERSNVYQVHTSPDGHNWTARAVGGSNGLSSDIEYADGLFVLVGSGPSAAYYIATSPDGITWTERSSGLGTGTLVNITHGDGLWVAIGTSSAIFTSPDGITWTSRTSAITGTLQGVTYGDGEFMTLSATSPSDVQTSPDGITWTAKTSFVGEVGYEVVYADGKYVAVTANLAYVGGVVISEDNGTTWTSYDLPTVAQVGYDIVYVNGSFVIMGGDTSNQLSFIASSNDGTVWHNHTLPALADNAIRGAAFGNGILVTVGDNLDSTYGAQVLTSMELNG